MPERWTSASLILVLTLALVHPDYIRVQMEFHPQEMGPISNGELIWTCWFLGRMAFTEAVRSTPLVRVKLLLMGEEANLETRCLSAPYGGMEILEMGREWLNEGLQLIGLNVSVKLTQYPLNNVEFAHLGHIC